MRSTKFEFVVNLQTAKLFGIDVPPTLLATRKEIDHALERIAEIEKHLGIDKKIAA